MGRIGKPQRSKKHKKVKQFKTEDEPAGFSFSNTNRKKKSINLDPRNPENQEMPNKVKFLMKNKNKFKSTKRLRKKKQLPKKDLMEPGMTKPMRSAPKFIQDKDETDDQFFKRIDVETNRVLLKSKLSDQYEVDFDDLEEGIVPKKKKSKEKSESKKRKEEKIKEMKKLQKLNKIKDREGDFSSLKDHIKFGEVVMEPPSLTAKPRKAPSQGQTKPGEKSLLLKDFFKEKDTGEKLPKVIKAAVKREVGKTVKRKQMCLAQQVIMDRERDNAIVRYRELKNKRIKQPIV